MIKNYYNFLRLLLLFVALSQVDTLFAQGIKVSGKIADSSSPEGVPGVLVSVKGKQQTTVSDMNGNYALTVADANAILQFKSVGYQTQEVAVKGRTIVNVTLVADLKSLDEVVVVGYGTQKKVDLVGAVASVKIDERLTSRALPNVSSALAGLAPGLAVVQSSGMAGNNEASLIIRGLGTANNASPLIVVDGMPDVDINRVNLNDVESISVLKDATSSAIYGSRAANGVILITTKTGKGASKTSIDFSSNMALETPTKGFAFMADYPRTLTLEQRAAAVSQLPSAFNYKNGTIDEWMAKGMIDPLRYPNTDWFDIITRDGFLQNTNLSATGGNDKSNFFASVGLKDEKGLQIDNDYKQYNARFNFDYSLRKNLKTGIRFNGNWSNYLRALRDGFTEPTSVSGGGLDMRYAIAGITPYDPETGYYGGIMAYNENILAYNPLVIYENRQDRTERQEANSSMYLEWSPIKGLKSTVEYGLRYYNAFGWSADIPQQAYNFQTNTFGRQYIQENAPIVNNTAVGYKTQFNGRVQYKTVIAKHHDITGLVGYSEEYWHDRTQGSSRNDRLYPTLHEIDAALKDIQETSGNSSSEGLQSVFGRLNYVAYNKYLLDANFRIDGSSKFAQGQQYGFFPSMGLGWRFTEESFLKPFLSKFLNSGKFRASYGALGNNTGVSRTEQQETLNANSYFIDGKIVKGFTNNKLVNQVLSWEKTTVFNAGLELGFLNDKLYTEFDYYDRLTTGMIRPSDISVHLAGAYNAPRKNIGNLRNRGIEGNITWRDKVRNVNYSFNLNASYNRSNLEKWNEQLNPGDANGGNNAYINMPYGYVYTYNDNGIAQTWQDVYNNTPQGANPGDLLRKDLNGDGRITGQDRQAYDNAQDGRPTTFFALNSFVSWKGIDLAVLLQGSAGRKDFWLNNYNTVDIPLERAALTQDQFDKPWSVENRDGGWPRLRGNNGNRSATTFWLKDMSFLRLKSIQLAYNLPKRLLGHVSASNLRIAVAAENLATITSYPGLDPEKSGSNDDVYPLNKAYTLSLQLGF